MLQWRVRRVDIVIEKGATKIIIQQLSFVEIYGLFSNRGKNFSPQPLNYLAGMDNLISKAGRIFYSELLLLLLIVEFIIEHKKERNESTFHWLKGRAGRTFIAHIALCVEIFRLAIYHRDLPSVIAIALLTLHGIV